MAVSDITASVLAITTATPTANSIEDAQRFVVANVPKNLLKWASTFTVPSNHGGNTSDGVKITMPTATDSILDVSRNGFSAIEVPYDMKGFIANTASLHLATSTYPKYYLDDTNSGEGVRIIVKPIPTDSATAVALYVDFTKIDDDSDLRNAVINYASSKEFSALAVSSTFPSMSWGKETPPVFTPPVLQQPDWSDVENWITTEEDSEMLSSRVTAIQSQIAEYTAKLQSAQAEFGADLQDYQARLAETVQLNQGQIAEWQAENGIKLSHYIQMSSQYYNWAAAEIKSYIENNTKTLEKVIELQRGK